MKDTNHLMPEFKAGMNWLDLQVAAPVHQVLAEAKDADLLELAIVGRDKAGELVILATHPNADAVLGLLFRGMTWLAEREQLAANDGGE